MGGSGSGEFGGQSSQGNDTTGATLSAASAEVPAEASAPSFDLASANLAAEANAASTAAAQPAAETSQTTASDRPSPTVTGLAAEIVRKLDGKVTRFDVTLDPNGLGKVNVSVEINAKGAMSATLSFEHPAATAALASESGALRQALQDAGFNLGTNDLSFQTGLQSSTGGGASSNPFQDASDQQRSASNASSAFNAMNRAAETADLSALASAAAASLAARRGIDIRI
jgi:hypothetical protein